MKRKELKGIAVCLSQLFITAAAWAVPVPDTEPTGYLESGESHE
jgi:hypothetical protein